MTKKPYYILFVYDTETKTWFDEFGDYTKASLKTEIEYSHYNIKKKHIKIIKTTDDKNAIKTAYENLEREIA